MLDEAPAEDRADARLNEVLVVRVDEARGQALRAPLRRVEEREGEIGVDVRSEAVAPEGMCPPIVKPAPAKSRSYARW